MGFQNPGITQSIPIVKHFLEMGATHTLSVCCIPHITFHVGGTGTQHKIQHILLQFTLDHAEGTLVSFIDCIIQRNGI